MLQPWQLSDCAQSGYWVVNHLVVLRPPVTSIAALVESCGCSSATRLSWVLTVWASSILPALCPSLHSVLGFTPPVCSHRVSTPIDWVDYRRTSGTCLLGSVVVLLLVCGQGFTPGFRDPRGAESARSMQAQCPTGSLVREGLSGLGFEACRPGSSLVPTVRLPLSTPWIVTHGGLGATLGHSPVTTQWCSPARASHGVLAHSIVQTRRRLCGSLWTPTSSST